MTSVKLVVLAIIIFVILVAGGYYISQRQLNQTGGILPLPKPGTSFSVSPKPASTANPNPSAQKFQTSVNSQPQTGENEIKNIGISLNLPAKWAKISSGANVAGSANVLDGIVNIRVKDANGKLLGNTYSIACMDTDSCPFETTIDFQTPKTPTGTVEAYSTNPYQKGQELYLQIVPVIF